MHKLFWILLVCVSSAFANDIDSNCPQHAYKNAPVSNADQYLCYTQYAIAYSYKTLTPVYSTYYLDTSSIGDVPRSDSFRADKRVPEPYRVSRKDYLNSECNGGHCDKGHMSPSEDFSSCVICVDESFYLTNIVPQNYKNNQVIWRYLEAKVRKYAQQKNPVYVITGPVYLRYPYTIIGRGIAVPEGLFKVIIDTVTGQSIAFYMDNQEVPISDLAGKVIPLNMLEAVVGLGFDESLDKTTSGSYQEWFSYLK